jgi:hypothetical protein
MINLMLGFDVLADPALATWVGRNDNTRQNFFLRPEIQWPISVDRLTCPSIFQPEFKPSEGTKLVLTRFPMDQRVIRAITQKIPDWHRDQINLLGLWTDLNQMLEWLNGRTSVREQNRFPIAIRVSLEKMANAEPVWETAARIGTKPHDTRQEWASLGYDVADQDQTSALSGIEYTPDEMTVARANWGIHVNDWGLLDDFEAAVEFKEFSTARLRKHASFYIYEIFSIEPHMASRQP